MIFIKYSSHVAFNTIKVSANKTYLFTLISNQFESHFK